ncbi:MAG: hypothetical protein R3195_12855 [Gemmatimonadota bacterium]|nr:hypothetical protein [Gemmatimonadota bacterium]
MKELTVAGLLEDGEEGALETDADPLVAHGRSRRHVDVALDRFVAPPHPMTGGVRHQSRRLLPGVGGVARLTSVARASADV